MRIWPAIDIRGGKCVRLTQGDYKRETVYGSSPADMAHRWVADGAQGLHIVDLEGARDGKSVNRKAIASIVDEVSVPLQLGGGIRDQNTIAEYLELGIKRLVIGTKALTDTKWFQAMCEKHPDQLLVAIDSRDGRVTTDSWQNISDVPATDLARRITDNRIAGIIYTDVMKDGMLSGPNFEAMKEMAKAVSVPLICSGGVTTTEDITQLVRLNLAGCVIGSALYEGRITLPQAIQAAGAKVSSP